MARMRTLLLLVALLDFPILCLCHPEKDSLLKISLSDQQRSRRSLEIVTTPVKGRKSYDNKEEKPIVKQHHFPISGTHASRRKFRFKRSAERAYLNSDPKNREKFAASLIEYTGWNPINYNDPMSNHPTLTYQPPALKRVHFGKDPPKSKPMFPILPQNPTVYVFALDKPFDYNKNSVYGPRSAGAYNLKQENVSKNYAQEVKSEKDISLLDQVPSASNYDANYIDKSLSLGDDDYYYYYDDDYDPVAELDDKKDLNIAPSASFATILSQQKPIASNTRSTLPFAWNSNTNKGPIEKKKSLHELLKGFNGINNERLTPSESKQSSIFRETPPADFRFRSIPNKEITGRKATPRKSTVKEEVPWFLIKTRSDELSKKKVDKTTKNSFKNSNAAAARNRYAYNPTLQQYVSLEKATESLTANSLSELLQIFDYITTPRTFQTQSERPESFFRQFRYTKNDADDKLTTKKPKSNKFKSPQRNDFRKKIISGSGIDDQKKLIDDSVAETNSLDGYLFADSQTLPEYSKPEKKSSENLPVKSSVKLPVNSSVKLPVKSLVKFSLKSPVKSLLKSLEKSKSQYVKLKRKGEDPKTKHSPSSSVDAKMDKDAIRRGVSVPKVEVDVTSPKIIANPTKAPQYPYLIHQGHSRVSIFGSAKNTQQKNALKITKRMGENNKTDNMYSSDSPNIDSLKIMNQLPPKTKPVTVIDPSLGFMKSNIQSQSSMPRATLTSISNININGSSDASNAIIGKITPANINTNEHLFETKNVSSEVNHPAGFLPSALEAFSKLFYGDLAN